MNDPKSIKINKFGRKFKSYTKAAKIQATQILLNKIKTKSNNNLI